MSAVRAVRRAWRRVDEWHPTQQVLRLVVLTGPLVALAAAGLAGDAPGLLVLLLAIGLSVGWAALPESLFGTLDLALVIVWWAQVPDDALHPAALLAAVAVVAAHVAAVLAGAAPPRTPVDPEVWRLWVRRAGLVLLPAPVLWGLARALRDEPAPAGLWPAALVVVLLALVVLGSAIERPEQGR